MTHIKLNVNVHVQYQVFGLWNVYKVMYIIIQSTLFTSSPVNLLPRL